MEPQQELSDEERRRLLCQVDACIEILSKRHNISPHQIVETVQWVEQHREFVSKLKHSGLLTLVGIVVSAAALAIWEGLKAIIRRGA